MDVGHNDPCLCGSGKKYKRCCGAARIDSRETAARAVRAAQESAERKVYGFLLDELGTDAVGEALKEFDFGNSKGRSGEEERQLLDRWLLYDWQPWEGTDPSGRPVGQNFSPARLAYVERHIDFSVAESRFLIAVMETPTSFLEVVSHDGDSLVLRDVLLERELDVFRGIVGGRVQPGDLLYARAVQFEGVDLFVGSCSFVIPPRLKGAILDARKALARGRKTLTPDRPLQHEPELRELYFDLAGELAHPPQPELANTDGDPLEFLKLDYALTDVDAAVAALAPLSSEPLEQLLAEARRPRPGGPGRVTLSWVRPEDARKSGMPDTVFAVFRVSENKLTVEVNSARRAQQVKAEMTTRLGESAKFVRVRRITVEEALLAASEPEQRRERADRLRREELEESTDVREVIAQITADYYAAWRRFFATGSGQEGTHECPRVRFYSACRASRPRLAK